MNAAALEAATAAAIDTLAAYCRARVRVEAMDGGLRLRGEFKTIEAVAHDLHDAGARVSWVDVPEDADQPVTVEVRGR